VFLVHGGDLGSNKTILAIEQDLVEALRH
jgi:hypothetical protein